MNEATFWRMEAERHNPQEHPPGTPQDAQAATLTDDLVALAAEHGAGSPGGFAAALDTITRALSREPVHSSE